MWPEVKQAADRHELKLNGAVISKRIEESALDENIFKLTQLNYLAINMTCLQSISHSLGELVNLTNLDLSGNKLESLPSTVGRLTKLKFLDLSNNLISELPTEIGQLEKLESLNASQNELTTFPCVASLEQLHYLVLAGNSLESLPDGITELPLLLELKAAKNQLQEIPDNLHELPLLRHLDLSENKITEVPAELCQCPKLKELELKENKLKDRRLKKLIEQSPTKSVLDYLKGILAKQQPKPTKEKRKKKKADGDSKPVEIPKDTVYIQRSSDIFVQTHSEALSVRPYIVCCVLRSLDLSKENRLKKFLSAQTRLHEGICQKRQAATIATHDLASISQPFVYTAQSPGVMQIWPLNRHREMSAKSLVNQLVSEAEELRKEKKRSTFSGVHKYLDLVRHNDQYACLCDGEDQRVISFPPITNSHPSKISSETRDVLVEVTSSTKQEVCKRVMDALLAEVLQLGLTDDTTEAARGVQEMTLQAASGDAADSDGDDLKVEFSPAAAPSVKLLHVEQVRVIDPSGNLKVVYPDKHDLSHLGPNVTVKRDM